MIRYEYCDVTYRSINWELMVSNGWITWTVDGNLATMVHRTDGCNMYCTKYDAPWCRQRHSC